MQKNNKRRVSMYRILSKYNLITVLPFIDTFFHSAQLQKKVKLSSELLKINYSKYSPFINPNIITLTSDKQLMLWFYTKKIKTPIIILESYLLFKELNKNNQDAIYIIHDTIIKILIIKESHLISAFTLNSVDEESILLSMDEYNISKRVDIQLQEYQTFKQSSLQKLTFSDFYHFNQLNFDRKTLLPNFIEYASYPIAILIIFAILVSYTQEKMLTSKIENLKVSYTKEKAKNQEIKTFIKKHNKKVEKWKNFVQKELTYVDPITLLTSLYGIFDKDTKAYLTDVSINGNKMLVKLATDENPVLFLNKLNNIKYISSVIIQNSSQPRNLMKIISYEIEIKMLKNV